MPVAASTSYAGAAAIHAGYYPGGKLSGNATEADDASGGGATPGLPSTAGGGATDGSASASGGATGPVVPTWRQGLTVLAATYISSNTIADVDPALDAAINGNSPQTRTNANWTPNGSVLALFDQWTGMAWCEALQEATAIGGGHAGWQGNCGFPICLDDNAPAFARRGYPSGSLQKPLPGGTNIGQAGSNNALVPDDRPAAVHSYNLLAAMPGGDVLLAPSGGRHLNGAGVFTPNGYRFGRSGADWDTSVAFAAPTAGTVQAGSACYDPVRDCLWGLMGPNLAKWDRATGTRTITINNGAMSGYYSRLIYDAARDLVWVFFGQAGSGGFASGTLGYFNPASGTTITLVTDGAATLRGGWAITHDTTRDRFILWNGSSTQLTVMPIPANINSDTFTSSTLSVSGGIDVAGAQGSFSQLHYSKKYDGVLKCSDASKKMQFIPFS